jgi:riboflavin transporter FmnP
VVEILSVINDTFDGLLGTIPCYNTIENWVKKCGLQVYETAGVSFQNVDYAVVVDESMMIGSEKLLLTLGVPAEHQGRPLNCADACVLDIAIADSWNGEGVAAQIRKAGKKVGNNPQYVISDNASIMNKGVRCAQMSHQHDISHSLGMYLERAYKEKSDFKEYVKSMTESKFKYNMKKIAYLLPPTQRTIARFINLSSWVKWSSKMLDIYHTLTVVERKVFSFIPANASLIDELSDVTKCIERIEYICKHNGLSRATICQCQKEIEKYLLRGNLRMIELGKCIVEFLRKEVLLIGSNLVAHNNSSDIIESIFGRYKARKSTNKLNGVTPYVLFIPVYTRLTNKEQSERFDFKIALEEKRIGDIETWAKKNLTPNLVQLRTKQMRKAG